MTDFVLAATADIIFPFKRFNGKNVCHQASNGNKKGATRGQPLSFCASLTLVSGKNPK